jgi:putative ABC transport system ATP-binding protein
VAHSLAELSGGEAQRVAIARALIADPQVILADEPTGNLDAKSGAVVLALLRELSEESGVTTILMTHDPETRAYADRVVLMRDGRLSKVDESLDLANRGSSEGDSE